nr:alpha-D-ribose 1-methylphosphonate 5-triphosphate diphosphatase [Streptomyces sp. NBC_00830]
MSETTIERVRVVPGVAGTSVADATVVVDGDGVVRAIEPTDRLGEAPSELLLIPAAVDLHLDVVANRRRPRASVELDLPGVIATLDAECAGAGIATVSIAARFEEAPAKGVRLDDAVTLCEVVEDLADDLACDWRIHGRVEVTDAGAVGTVEKALQRTGRLVLLSLMEHSAEQTRFASAEENRQFYAKDWGVSPEEVDRIMAESRADRAEVEQRRRAVADIARESGVVLASHDDRTPEQVTQAHELGATVAEFPLTLAAARRARELGMRTVLGAPNAVRGRSTAPGNLLVAEAVEAGVCDIICSDYLPGALLQAPLVLARRGVAPLADLVDLIAANPAAALGITPPAIAVGQPLDAVLLRQVTDLQLPVATWRGGRLLQRRGATG